MSNQFMKRFWARKHEVLVSKTEIAGFSYIPSHPNLAGLTIELLDKPKREYYLQDFCRRPQCV